MILLGAASIAAEPRGPAVAAAEQRTYAVVKGDTLASIARRFKVTVAALVSANRLTSESVKLKIGQKLVIPSASGKAVVAASTSTTPRAVTASRASAGPREPASPRPPVGLALAVPDFVDAAPPFTWPVEGTVTSLFGRRRSGWHRGIDVKADRGTIIFAAAEGTVVVSGVEPRYGRVVKIEHDDGFLTVYAHNEENLVEVGMRVGAGDPIATLGRTGRATAHHVHFEIRRNGSVYNPLYLLPNPRSVSQVEEGEETEE
jgi:murein DD-endopeptidase MepM/ murein hydrolase activator NlpD